MRKTPYPLMGLTRRGAGVMKGDNNFRMAWPDRNKMVKPAKSAADNHGLDELAFDEGLFERLKEVRKKLAEEAGGVPPYVIFGNQVLEIFTRLRPATEAHALKIHGVGKVKAERYLEPFLKVIRDFGK